MCRRLISILLITSFSLASTPVFAAPKNKADAENVTAGPRRHLSKIVFAGLAGAILGLSTLSFFGRPQEKLSYIPIGFAVGVIGGAMFTTYKAATEPKDFYGLESKPLTPESWTLMNVARGEQNVPSPQAGFSFTF